MIPDDIESLALADAIGALDAAEQRDLLARLETLPAQVRAEVARLYDVALSVAAAAPPADPPARVREQLLARISAPPPNYSIGSGEGQWNETPFPGITAKVLAIDRERGLVTMLLRGEAGARYPSHRHSTPEECYVISGSVVIEGRVHRAGDFHHADGDSHHGEVYTTEGAEVLIVGAIEDYLPGA